MPKTHALPAELPPLSWDLVETVMLSLAPTASKQLIVRHLVEGTRKQAPFLPAEETFREILWISFALMDEDFQPSIFNSAPPSRV